MKVYKFGGASVKSAEALKNALEITIAEKDNLIIVVSAMGKTTNNLEIILNKYYKKIDFSDDLNNLKSYHLKIVSELFDKENQIFSEIENIFSQISDDLIKVESIENYDKKYDAIISYGELISSLILSSFLNSCNLKNELIDARKIIITDNNFRAANVNFNQTETAINKFLDFSKNKVFITQGFIGSTSDKQTTTLGREGSDYTASIIAGTLKADELVLWKDVEGIYNADPKITDNVVKLNEISFREATELAYYGAQVIHPKTAKPIMYKNVKLIVKSFVNKNSTGTTVGNFAHKISPMVPITIFKINQVLVTLSTKEFDFIDEIIFEKVFSILNLFKIKINLMQNTALNLSLCFDYNPNSFDGFINHLKQTFIFKYNTNLTLITIRHYTDDTIKNIIKDKTIKLEQKNKLNAFYLIEN